MSGQATNVVRFFTDRGWRVTSPFGWRTHPITGNRDHHNGIDFGGPSRGEPVLTPYAGTVSAIGYFGSRGNVVVVKSASSGLMLLFQHLHAFRVKRGDVVKVGDIVGTNGSTGAATGPHVHFEIRYDNGSSLGSPVWGDPAKYQDKPPAAGAKTHTVMSGDTLGKIAPVYGVAVDDLVAWNKAKYPSLGDNRDLIRVGWELYVAPPIVAVYTVVSGDVFWRIARDHNVTIDELIAVNPQIADPGKIYPGDKINIPAAIPQPEPEPEPSELEKALVENEKLKEEIAEEQKRTAAVVSEANELRSAGKALYGSALWHKFLDS